MRFDSARAAGLDEQRAERVSDGYEATLSPREAAALALTDAVIGDPRRLDPATRDRVLEHFTPEQIVELLLGVGLFLGMSKVLITLGLEPEAMEVTVLPTPGSRAR